MKNKKVNNKIIIQIDRTTALLLKRKKVAKKETYDEIINRLIINK